MQEYAVSSSCCVALWAYFTAPLFLTITAWDRRAREGLDTH